jgi:hypothetical protein
MRDKPAREDKNWNDNEVEQVRDGPQVAAAGGKMAFDESISNRGLIQTVLP